MENKNAKIVICEDDSARGAILATIHESFPKNVDVFPIRGKIINSFKCTKEKFFSNEEDK